jgi:hypothetical protein
MSKRFAKYRPQEAAAPPENPAIPVVLAARAVPVAGKIPCWYSNVQVPITKKKSK